MDAVPTSSALFETFLVFLIPKSLDLHAVQRVFIFELP